MRSQTLAPLVSVCIPTYRGEAHLGAAIDSVLTQTFTDFELVIINDNSPDNTDAIVAAHRDPRVLYIRNPTNLGPEGNWNRCLVESRGRYIKLFPQDDLLFPQCLEKQVRVLEEDEQQRLALVFCARKIVDARGHVITIRGYPRGKSGIIHRKRLIRRCLQYGTNLVGEPGSVLFRRELAQKVGHFDGSISYIIDLDYWFRLLLKGDAYYLSEPLSAFRVSPGSWSVAIGIGQSADFRLFMDRVSQNPSYGARRLDIVVGRRMASINKLMRLLFYRCLLK